MGAGVTVLGAKYICSVGSYLSCTIQLSDGEWKLASRVKWLGLVDDLIWRLITHHGIHLGT